MWRWRRRTDEDFGEEIQANIALDIDRLMAEGMSSDEARSAALRAFGNVTRAQERFYESRRLMWLDDLQRDVRYALRTFVKNPGFTAVAIVTLGLGIGVNNTLFIVVNAVCLRGLPIERPERVLFVNTRDARHRELGLSYRDFDNARTSVPAFAGLAAFANAPVSIGDEGRAPDRELGTYISAEAFRLLGEHPVLGRDLTAGDDKEGASPVAILGHGLWTARYGGDPSIVGRTIRINGRPTTVVGVMRDPFKFPGNTEVWLPMALMPGPTRTPVGRPLGVFGRLTDATTPAQAHTELAALSNRLSRDYADTNQAIRLTAMPINERYSQRITDPNWVAFLAIGVVVVLIACANVANLLLMRALRRAHEMATRASLGATRGHLVRQLLVESALLATFSGGVGLALSLAGARLLSAMIPPNTVPYWLVFSMDTRTFTVLCLVCLGTVLVFGLAPAVHVAKADVNQVMKSGGRSGAIAPRERRWTMVFLIAEVGLSMLFLSALVVGLRTLRAAERADLVIDPTNLLTTSVSLPNDKYRTPEQRIAFYQTLADRMAGMPSISSAAMATALPLSGAVTRQLAVDGRPTSPGVTPPNIWMLTVSPRYFEVMGLHLIGGRAFDERDGTNGRDSAIVNQRFAQMHFPGTDPVGRRIRVVDASRPGGPTAWLTIVGVSPTVRQSPALDPEPMVYTPLRASPPATAAIIVRGSTPSAALAPLLRDAVRDIDPDLPLYRVMPMEQALNESQWAGRGSIVISMTIVWIAIGMAAVGLYAVTAHSVVERTQEIGVRMALGARTADVIRLVARRVVVELALGMLAGVVFTLVWSKMFSATQATYNLTDPASLIGGAIFFAMVAALACTVPVRRAIRVEPVVALRYE
jgi:putative ABC transport system permease protein